jgi:hypothetical protein
LYFNSRKLLRKKHILIIINIFIIVSSEFSNEYPSNYSIKYYKDNYCGMNFDFSFGTHINGIGINIFFDNSLPILIDDYYLGNFQFFGKVNLSYYITNLGIQGSSQSLDLFSSVRLGIGNKSDFLYFPYMISNYSFFTISYGFIYFLTTDLTSQPIGTVSIEFAWDKNKIKIQHDNDYWLFNGFDQYRTAAFDISYFRTIRNNIIGGGIGIKLWTGTRNGLKRLSRNQNYELSKQFGGNYSHGIFYLSFFINGVNISLGYDSEKIRDLLQNSFHYLINAGNIPPLQKEDSFYFEISFNKFAGLY